MFVIYKGIDSIRVLLNIKAPCSSRWPDIAGLGLPKGRRIRAYPLPASALIRASRRPANSGIFFVPALTGMIGFGRPCR